MDESPGSDSVRVRDVFGVAPGDSPRAELAERISRKGLCSLWRYERKESFERVAAREVDSDGDKDCLEGFLGRLLSVEAGGPNHPVVIGRDNSGDDEVIAGLGEPVECIVSRTGRRWVSHGDTSRCRRGERLVRSYRQS